MFSRETLALMEAAVDAVVVIDHRGTVQAINDATSRMFGYRADELLGENVRKLMPEPDRGRHDGYIARYLDTHQPKIKEIRLRPKTDIHDIATKVTHAREFLGNKDKVVVSVVFRGRELAHVEEGHKVVATLIKHLEDIAKVESAPSQQGRRIVCVLTPK